MLLKVNDGGGQNCLSQLHKKKEIQSIYALKAICALLVICIHAPSMLTNPIHPITRLAVPCFFMISGFFIASDKQTWLDNKQLKKLALKILKITITANLVYLCYGLISDIFNGTYPIEYCTTSFWLRQLVFGGCISGPLWYLTAYLEILVLLILFNKFNLKRLFYLLAFCGWLVNLCTGRYAFLWDTYFYDVDLHRNVFVSAFPMVASGMFIKEKIGSFNFLKQKPVCILSIVIIFLFVYVEYAIQKFILLSPQGIGEINISTLPASVLLLVLAIQHPSAGGKYLQQIGKNLSLDLYLYHWLVIAILYDCGITTKWIINALVVASLTLGMTILVKKVITKSKFLYANHFTHR